jgi:L-threonylcarbamoyladenylate synthase
LASKWRHAALRSAYLESPNCALRALPGAIWEPTLGIRIGLTGPGFRKAELNHGTDNVLTVTQGAEYLRAGKVIAYPTEAVFGLGCDPASEEAVRRILQLKLRDADLGLILIADSWEHLAPFAQRVDSAQLDKALATWPGPVTWLFPRATKVPDWLAGKRTAGTHPTIALRVSAHPTCRALCAKFEGAIVSTSANPHAAPPAISAAQVRDYFADDIDGIVAGKLGTQHKPSEIRDLLSGRVIRAA